MAIGSSLATLHMWSPNHYNGRAYPISKLTIHHVAGKVKAATLGNVFLNPERKASSTYGIGYDGETAQFVDEADAPWTSSNYDNDNRAITIEVSNSACGGDWPVSDAALEALIRLCADCVRRNPGIKEIDFTGDKSGNLTMHKWFAATACPGPYLESKFPYIAAEVNRRLGVPESDSAAPEKDAADVTLEVGDVVALAPGAKYINGKSCAEFLYKQTLYVRDIEGDNITISYLKTGPVSGVVNRKYLTKNGQTVTAPAEPEVAEVKLDPAQSGPDKSKAGTYRVKSSIGLKLRTGASTDKTILETMSDGSLVNCYGYYTGEWLYVVSASGKKGFCHSGYLVRV